MPWELAATLTHERFLTHTLCVLRFKHQNVSLSLLTPRSEGSRCWSVAMNMIIGFARVSSSVQNAGGENSPESQVYDAKTQENVETPLSEGLVHDRYHIRSEAIHCNLKRSHFPLTLAAFLALPDARIPPVFRDVKLQRLCDLGPCEIHGPAVQVRCWRRPRRWIRTPKWNLREGRTWKVNEFLEEVPRIRPYFHCRA